MKTLNLLLFFVSMQFCFTVFGQRTIPGDFMLEDYSGNQVNFKEYLSESGKITVVSFWATWCKPCKEELDIIQSDYLEDWKEDFGIEFIAISMDNSRTRAKVKGVVDAKGWDYTILYDPDNSAYQKLGFQTVPYNILLDESGEIVYRKSGYKPGDEEELEMEIQKLTE